MPAIQENKDLKLYYSIKEVAEMFNVSEPTLRYWEKEFPHLHPKVTANRVRQYTEKDIDDIKVIYNLIKERGFKIAAARKMIHSNRQGVDTTKRIMEKLTDVRDTLRELKASLDSIS